MGQNDLDESLKKLRQSVKELRENKNITFAEMTKTKNKKDKKIVLLSKTLIKMN